MTTQPTRDQIPGELKEDLSQIFENLDAFEAAFAELLAITNPKNAGKIEQYAQYKGRLAESGEVLLAALKFDGSVDQKLTKLHLYTLLRKKEDEGDETADKLRKRFEGLSKKVGEVSAWFNDELSLIAPEVVKGYMEKSPELAVYGHFFEKLWLDKAHVRNEEVTRVIAQARPVLAAARDQFGATTQLVMPQFMPRVPVKFAEDGTPIKRERLTISLYQQLMESPHRVARKQAWMGLMRTFGKFSPSLAVNYATAVNAYIFNAQAHRYETALERALAHPRLPMSLYTGLIASVRGNLPIFHEYLDVVRGALKVDKLHLYDLNCSLLPAFNPEITIEKAKQLVLDSVAVLGDDYVDILRRFFNSGRIDWVPNIGKHNGAFQFGIPGSPAYVSMNFTGRFKDAETLDHEAGHYGHSVHANGEWEAGMHSRQELLRAAAHNGHEAGQPFVYAGYPTFCAEVASLVHEQLLRHHVLKTTDDPRMRLYVLGKQLNNFRGTVDRQTQLADFEQQVFALAEKGEALTNDVLCNLYLKICKEYFEPAVSVDKVAMYEWAYIPHFAQLPLYVYTYATGQAIAMAIAAKILREGKPAAEAYRNFLRAGQSRLALDILREAGVDMSTSAPINEAFKMFQANVRLFKSEMERFTA